MIAGILTNDKGEVVDGEGKSLTQSPYNPPQEILDLFSRVQKDYLANWALQNRPFNEFDQLSLLQRTNLDQQTFGAFVGATFLPATQSWRWRGRKNTARNKIIGILAHVISGMLYPFVYAYNEENKEDEMTAKVMRILIENHLKKANYEMKFLFMMLSALVNPAVFVEVEYVEAMQRIKTKMKDGSYKLEEVVDELISGIGLNIIPIDSLLLADFFTFDIQRQPNIARVRRISYDEARAIYAGKYFIDGKDQFDFVEAGKTKIVPSGVSKQIVYDVDWTVGDENMVQEVTMYYRGEDLEVTFVGGVFMGNYHNGDVMNCNPFKHRRMSMIGNEYKSIPIYPFAKSGFEPLDPNGRFAYYKSAAFKEFWDDASLNRMYQLAQDGTFLDVIKPIFGSGVASLNADAMVPGNFIGMPQGASVTPYQLSPNVNAALALMRQNTDDLSLSTQDALQSGVAEKGVTATASIKAEQNAKVIMNVFSTMVADLVRQIGSLVMDDILAHTTVGEVDATVPEALVMKYKTIRLQSKENGKEVNQIISFESEMMGEGFTEERANELEWKMFEDNGGMEAKTYEYKVNPYKFARTSFSMYVDPQKIISRSMGSDQIRKERAFQMLADPRIAPYVNMEAVVDKFILQEYSDGDPDELKAKPQNNQMLESMMGAQGPMPQPTQGVIPTPAVAT